MIAEPKLEYRKEQHYAAIRVALPIPFGKFLPSLWDEVNAWLKKDQSVASPGPAIIRYLTTNMSEKLDLDVGFILEGAVPSSGRIRAGVLPAGQYATLLYTGPYKGKGIYKATVALLDWAKENKIVWNISIKDGVEWWNGRTEYYLTNPDYEPNTKKYRTELAFLVK
ncbi:MAG: GyrI-like domain-containing protein [Anaerolineales bacterium]